MIKQLLLRIYKYFQRLNQNYKYWKELRFLIAEIKPQSQLPEMPEGKYLILIPHSDDEWIGNSTLISNAKYQVELFDMDMKGGDSLSLHKDRFAEMKAISTLFGRRLYSKKEGKRIEDIIERYNPDFVAVPYFFDWHLEHREVMKELRDCKTKVHDFKVAMYQVTVPIMKSNITNCNVMAGSYCTFKWNLFKKIYKTQAFFPSYRVSCHERINGAQYGLYACEVFSVLDFSAWKDNFERIIPDENEINQIKSCLNSLAQLRECKQNSLLFSNNKDKI